MDHWLTLSQAATHVGCSRKTIYRYMNRGLLAYRRGANNRRYVLERDIVSLFVMRQAVTANPNANDPSPRLEQALGELVQIVGRQNALLVRMIELYQPKTLQDIIRKHT